MIILEEYIEYLSKKHKNQKTINERTEIINKLRDFLTEKDLTGMFDEIGEFFRTENCLIINKIRFISPVETKKIYECMEEYILFVKKECKEPEAITLAETIYDYMIFSHEQKYRNRVNEFNENILMIPEGVKFNPKYLKGLTDKQLCNAFYRLQLLIKNIYDNISVNPFNWGYPDYYTTIDYNPISSVLLYGFAFYGIHNNGILTIETKSFLLDTSVKRYKKIEIIFEGFKKMGLIVEGFDKKAEAFSVTFPENPHVITALHVYGLALKETHIYTWGGDEAGTKGRDSRNFSYRHIEDPATQEYEAIFYHVTDYYPDELVKIQQWLHAEAAKYGYKIDPESPTDKGFSLAYRKGSKHFLSVGYVDGVISSKVIFRDVFKNNIDKVEHLAIKFPGTFVSNCWDCNPGCSKSWRINYELFGKKHRSCAMLSFWFKGVTIDNVDSILELFKIENKINS